MYKTKSNSFIETSDFLEYGNHSSVKDFITLLKPRVMALVVFTSLIGLYVAPGTIHPVIAIVAIICIALGSGAAGAINMWYDRDIDAVMSRTKKRALPSGKIHPTEALHFAVFLAFTSVLTMGLLVNLLSAIILAVSIFVYVLIYTVWLKRRTPQNIVIGGAAGAFPPMIGWSAATNNISTESFLLFLIIFLWTPPHFWTLAIYNSTDYKKANIPMMPIVKGIKHTQKQIMIYSILLYAVSLIPYFIDMFGNLYLTTALLLGAMFVWHAYRLYVHSQHHLEMFKYSIIYLFLLFSAMLLDGIVLI